MDIQVANEIIEKGKRLGVEDALLLNSSEHGANGRVSIPTVEYERLLDAVADATLAIEAVGGESIR